MKSVKLTMKIASWRCFSLKTDIFLKLSLILVGSYLFQACSAGKSTEMPKQLRNYIANIEYSDLGESSPKIQYEVLPDNKVKVLLSWDLKDTLLLDDWQVKITPSFNPDFHWSPHLTPTDEHIIPQHVFRAPALIVSSDEQQLSILPDLDIMKKAYPVEWYMDLNAQENFLVLGLSKSKIKEHVLYTRDSGAIYPPGEVNFGFYIIPKEKQAGLGNPWREINAFFWKNWGTSLYGKGAPLPEKDFEPYVQHTYTWAFDHWKDKVWQHFINENGEDVGAPIFIVNYTKSPNFSGEPTNREFTSIWNQAWFNSLRSASGLYRYARRTGNEELLEYALKTKELALSFPQKEGFFYSVVAPEEKSYKPGEPWKSYYYGNSNRNPYTSEVKKAPFHVLDMSFTAFQMLNWYEELENDERLLEYATTYADALIEIQDENGFFPGWLSIDTLKPMVHLNQSPETSMSVTFLLKMFEITGNEIYKDSAVKAMNAVIEAIIPVGRWEDFETYWSCSSYGSQDLLNKKVKRNNMYKQNNLSMYWTAEALLAIYETTKEQKYLEYGQRTLDELLMTQAVWQPPYMYVPVFGGFGVMNADAEWNDSRQSLFSGLILRYGEVLDQEEFIQRGIAALKASFSMMYSSENLVTKKQWEARYPFFGEEDYGFMMENYGHNGTTDKNGIGIGEFTIYDWGNGAAAEAYNRLLDKYGKDFLKLLSHEDN